LVLSGSNSACRGCSGAGETSTQNIDRSKLPSDMQKELENGDGEGVSRRTQPECAQMKTTGVPGMFAADREIDVAPSRGSVAAAGDKVLLLRPNCSWVAGRTGFGPVGTGNDLGLFGPSIPAKAGAGASDVVDSVQPEGQSAVGGEAGVISTGEDLPLGCVSPGIGFLDGKLPEGGREENLRGTSRDADKEESPITKRVNRTVEVSKWAGLSSDGQEGRKVECLKRLIVEKYGAGGGNGSASSNDQKEEESISGDWGNCSDYEA
jgi:hypothetical protein